MGLKFKRLFTTEGVHPYGLVKWERTDVTIGDSFSQKDVEFPTFWSETARKIVASKYFYGFEGKRENSLRQIIDRVVGRISYWGNKEGYFDSDEDYFAFVDELTHILLHQKASFNSPVWFNIGNDDLVQQASACYINSVGDTMPEILDLAKTEGMIFKRGSGAGVNLSNLRAEGEPLSGGGTASGPLSFMKGWDAFAGVIKSGGVTRRAAKMIILDADHPDIQEFIQSKVKEETKALVLIEAGYDGAIDGEAYGSVFYQNANHSIRVSDDFMNKVVNTKSPYYLHYRVTPESIRQASIEECAEVLLLEAAQAAWKCGDPGIMFGDRMNEWNTCKESGEIVATNPCSEYIWFNDTSCNLASIRLSVFYAPEVGYYWHGLEQVIKVMITAMDILCGNAEYPTEKITRETLKYRTLGLGYSDLGGVLMAQGLPYDSTRGREFAAQVMAFITGHAYLQSSTMAMHLGAFSEHNKNASCMLKIIDKHIEHLPLRVGTGEPNLEFLWERVKAGGVANGFRNAQVTVLAPAGTISFMMDCDTTGVEPLIAMEATKNLVGGGVIDLPLPKCAKIGHDLVPDFSSDVFATAIGDNQIDPMGHLLMVAAVQPLLSGGVSKTINLPNSATFEDIFDLYIAAWEHKLKTISVYRDGSKHSQPLEVKKKDTKLAVKEVIPTHTRRKMPIERQSLTHKFNISGHKGYITVGLFEDGTPGEIFVTMAKEGSTISGLMDAFATTVSFGLQYGIPLEFFVRKLKDARYEPSGYTGYEAIPYARSITDYIFRWLEYRFLKIKAEETTEKLVDTSAPFCSKCEAQMERSGSCYTCPSCGETSGGC